MSNDYNHMAFTGRLLRDPEQRQVAPGRFITAFGVAINRTYRDADGKLTEVMVPAPVEATGKVGDACAEYLRKGSAVLVEGSLAYSSWVDKEHNKRHKYFTSASKVKFLDHPNREERSAEQDGVAGEITPPPLAPQPSQQTQDDEPPF